MLSEIENNIINGFVTVTGIPYEMLSNKLLQNKFTSLSKGINSASLTKRTRLDHLREEFGAWEIAFELADEFDIEIDYSDMRILLHSCLFHYIEWFKNPKKYRF